MKHKIKTFHFKLIPYFFIAICLLSLNENLQAQPGTIDSSFGTNGRVFITEIADLYAVALQTDGKIVAPGSKAGIVLTRYRPDGSPDLPFGELGKVETSLTSLGVYGATARAIAVQEDGKIIIAGYGYYEIHHGYDLDNYVVVLVRYNTDGSPDKSFGDNGVVVSDFGEEDDDLAYCIMLQADGRIVVGGKSQSPLLVARYMPDGSLDNSFSEDGWLKDEHYGFDVIYSIAVQPDGRIVAGGTTDVSPDQKKFILERYLPDGRFDSSFSDDGIVINDIAPGGDELKSLALQPDGKIIATGQAGDKPGPNWNLVVVRYQPDGSYDSTFGENGKVITIIGTRSSKGRKVLLQEDKQIIIAGTNLNFIGSGVPADYALVKYNKDGSLNTHFGDGGIVITDVNGGSRDEAYDAVLQPDGKIVIAGDAGVGINSIVRYNGEKIESPWFAKLKKWLHHHGFTWDDFPHLTNGDIVTVERSANGTVFNPIATLTSHRSNQLNRFEDPAPLAGTNYYRLSAVAADGSNISSNVLAIENNNTTSIKIYPNPAKNNLVIEGLPSTGNTKLRITDLYGSNVFKSTANTNTHTCNIAALKAGTYIITIETGNETITRKLVKQ